MSKFMTNAKAKFNTVVSKLPGDSQVVVALILIVVAIGLCIIFRNEVNTIIQNVAGKVTEAVNNLSAGTVN